MNDLTLLTYTHNKCVDLHKPYFERIKKYFPKLINHYVTCDVEVPFVDCFVYNDTDNHSKQMIDVLNQIPTDYVIYSQEDYILFDYVNDTLITEYIQFMKNNPNVGFIRLIQSGVDGMNNEFNDDLYYVDSDSIYFYSTQATIWRKNVLVDMFSKSNAESIFSEPDNSKFLKELNCIGLYTKQHGTRVGFHFNSTIYPYIATAINKGKWNMTEYQTELHEMFIEYGINPFERGIVW